MKKRRAIGIAAVIGFVGFLHGNPTADSAFTISSHANIYGAGLPGDASMPAPSGGGGGVAPAAFPLTPGENQIITFAKASGTVDFGNASSPTGPDGGNFGYGIAAHRGISSFGAPVVGCLVGVFLEKDGPGAEAPKAIDLGAKGIEFTSLSPQIGQVFFVGNGITKDGYTQQFRVPPTASFLYLGFADSYYSGAGPGYYGDNTGQVSITVLLASTTLDFPKIP